MEMLLSLVKRRPLSLVLHTNITDRTTLESMKYKVGEVQEELTYGFFRVSVMCHMLYRCNEDRQLMEVIGVYLPEDNVAVIGKSEKEFISFLGAYYDSLRQFVRPFYKERRG